MSAAEAFLRQLGFENLLNFIGRQLLRSPAEALAEARDVRVDREAGKVKVEALDDGRGLRADAGQRGQIGAHVWLRPAAELLYRVDAELVLHGREYLLYARRLRAAHASDAKDVLQFLDVGVRDLLPR